VGSGVVIKHPIRISNSVIMPNVVVDAATDLDCVVMDGEHTVYCPSAAAYITAPATS
jgi:ADP-glucose pyrophosphorylase